MGVRKSAKRTRGQAKQRDVRVLAKAALWSVGLSPPRKARPGKPTLSDEELIARRDPWAHLLGTYWGVVGWELECARTLEDIHRAFQPLTTKYPEHLVAPFLRPTIALATAESIRETKKEHGEAASRLREAEERQNAEAELVRQAEGASFEFSDKHPKQLRAEIKYRNTNLREIKIRITNQKGRIVKAKIALEKSTPQGREAPQAELNSLETELGRIRAEYTGEQKILQQIKERLGAITPERRKRAADILGERKTALNATEQELSEARRKWKELEEKLSDQEAYYFRTELLKFIHAKRYGHTPRNLASALAGLPEMSCRHSADRCAKLLYSREPNLIYRVFEFSERTWEVRSCLDPLAAVRLFRTKIAKLPKTALDPKWGRIENFLRRYLEENWAYLKRAIEDGVSSSTHPRQVPYLITAKFQENLSKPRTQADILFAEQERLPAS